MLLPSFVPENYEVKIKSLKGVKISSVKLLENEARIEWNESEDGIEFHLPENIDTSLGYVLEIEISGNI